METHKEIIERIKKDPRFSHINFDVTYTEEEDREWYEMMSEEIKKEKELKNKGLIL